MLGLTFFLLLSGLVAFRQHLQNLARTKGILELNKVQMLVEHMGSREGAAMSPVGPQHHLHNLLEVSIHTTLKSNPVKLFSVTHLPSPRDRQRGEKNQAPRLLCNPKRGSQLWLVYCLPSHWGLEPRPM